MKKLVLFSLTILLLFPAAAGAVTGNSPYYGQWIGQKHGSTGTYSKILYYLNITKYKTCEYFEICILEGGGAGQGSIADSTVYSGHWEIVDDHLSIPTSEISYIEVFYDKDSDTLYTTEWPQTTFARIP